MSVYYSSKYVMAEDVRLYHWTRVISSMTGWLCTTPVPSFLRSPIYGGFSSFYGVDTEDFIGEFADYATLTDFFTRPVRPRTIDTDLTKLVAPADSKVLSITEVTDDSVFLVKGRTYSFTELVTGVTNPSTTKGFTDRIKHNPDNKMFSVVFYLCPGDYHRYHSPADINVKQRIHIAGNLYPVKPSFVENHDKVYESNERISVFSDWAQGNMNIVFVGATNVGSMTLDIEPTLETNLFNIDTKINVRKFENVNVGKGDQMGMFKFGSTVVAVFEAPADFKWDVKEGDAVRYGQVFGHFD